MDKPAKFVKVLIFYLVNLCISTCEKVSTSRPTLSTSRVQKSIANALRHDKYAEPPSESKNLSKHWQVVNISRHQ